jgi:hypothetical protein
MQFDSTQHPALADGEDNTRMDWLSGACTLASQASYKFSEQGVRAWPSSLHLDHD